MDLQAPQVPGIEIVFAQTQETDKSPKTSRKERVPSVVDEILSIPTPPKTPIEQLQKSKSSSSGEDSLGSFREISNLSSSIMKQLREEMGTLFSVYMDTRSTKDAEIESLFEKAMKDHLQVLQHIQKFTEANKETSKFNQQFREDFGSIKHKVENANNLCEALKSELSATQERVNLLQKSHKNHQPKEIDNSFLQTSQQLLNQFQESSSKHEQSLQKYNSIIESVKERIQKLEELYQQLASKPAQNPLLNRILSTPRLSQAMTTRNQPSNSAKIDEMTLEDILTQQQEELLEMEKMIKALNTAPKKEPDYDNIFNNLRTQIATAENKATAAETKNGQLVSETQSLMRKVHLWMTASTAVLLASFWFWWQAHKA